MSNISKAALLRMVCDFTTYTPYVNSICEILAILYKRGERFISNTEYGSLNAFGMLDLSNPLISEYIYDSGEYKCLAIQPAVPVYGVITVSICSPDKISVGFYGDWHKPIPENILLNAFKSELEALSNHKV